MIISYISLNGSYVTHTYISLCVYVCMFVCVCMPLSTGYERNRQQEQRTSGGGGGGAAVTLAALRPPRPPRGGTEAPIEDYHSLMSCEIQSRFKGATPLSSLLISLVFYNAKELL